MQMLPPAVACSCCHRRTVDAIDVYPLKGARVTLCLPCWLERHDVRLQTGAVALTNVCPRRLVIVKPEGE